MRLVMPLSHYLPTVPTQTEFIKPCISKCEQTLKQTERLQKQIHLRPVRIGQSKLNRSKTHQCQTLSHHMREHMAQDIDAGAAKTDGMQRADWPGAKRWGIHKRDNLGLALLMFYLK